MAAEGKPSIPECFRGKSAFITGASGFLGKALIDKLLRSCPDIRNVYILLRPKKGLEPQERLDRILADPLFDRLKTESNNDWRSKIKFITGDVTELHLGISENERKCLIENVNFFFHVAATVKFDDPLQSAIITNTRGTREACNLALEMKNIETFLHVSTTYCNLDREVVEEKLYPPHADWRQAIEIAEKMDSHEMQIISNKFMDNFPNTYTFTKSMAEHVVNDLCNGRIPVIIIRPSIVISSKCDPVPGWIDNFNGPAGIMAGSGKGILRTSWGNERVRMDYVPVDYLIKAFIVSIWYRSTSETSEEKLKLEVYNASADLKYAITLKEMLDMGRTLVDDYPLKNPLWYPGGGITTCKIYYFIQILFLHLLPALLIDLVLRAIGQKPMLFKIQRKIYVANTSLQHFINHEWMFVNEKTLEIRSKVLPEDENDFDVEINVDHIDFMKNAIIGAKTYLLKEDLNDLEQDRARIFRMKLLHYVTKYLFYLLMFYMVFRKFNVLKVFTNVIASYYLNLKT